MSENDRDDIDTDYDEFLSECAKHCHCDYDICDSVLAGAPCEERRKMTDEEEEL
jgi:hypothetical protein